MREQQALNNQIDLIEDAMKKAGVWSFETPDWIRNYKNGQIHDIWQWLQFVHLPLRRNGTIGQHLYLAPQISHMVMTNKEHNKILQLVIELDSITSTLNKPNSSKP